MNFIVKKLFSSPILINFGKFSTNLLFSTHTTTSKTSLLQPQLVKFDQIRGYKQKRYLRKRCVGCYFVWRVGRLYVECTKDQSHKQHHIRSTLKGYDYLAHGYKDTRRGKNNRIIEA
jgi:ribosomal protein L36